MNETCRLETIEVSRDKLKLLEYLLAEEGISDSEAKRIGPRGEVSHIPLSFAQQRLWFLDQMGSDGAVYNIAEAYYLTGPLNLAAFQSAINEIICRHEVLRTTFRVQGGQPVQVISSHQPQEILVTDLSTTPVQEMQMRVRRLAAEDAEHPFDLTRGPLLRASLLRLNEGKHVLILCMHHIVSDGWSMNLFFRELAVLYEAFSTGTPSPLAAMEIQYADFAIWQRNWLQGDVLQRQLDYWKRQLMNLTPELAFPTDRPRQAIQTHRGENHSFVIPKLLTEQLKAFCQNEGVTLFMLLLAAFKVLLYRHSGQEDIVIGSPIAGRTHTETEELIGFFVNTLVLRSDLSGNPSFRGLLAKVRETAMAAYAHQDVPFEKLVEELNPERSLSHSPLFQIMFALENVSGDTLSLADLTVAALPTDADKVPFDLTCSIVESKQELRGSMAFNSDLFEATTVARLGVRYRTLLQSIVEDPRQKIAALGLLTDEERHQLKQWNDTRRAYPRDRCLAELFEAQVERLPEAVAVVHEGQQVVYRELNRRANQLGHYLRKMGIGPEVLVGICLDRSVEMVVGLLGILKAGGAYVPLDPAYPRERLDFMLKDASVGTVLTTAALLSGLPKLDARVVCLDTERDTISRESEENVAMEGTPGNLAYVIYTSGSTGRPKGVQIPHRAILNLLASMRHEPGINCGDVLLAVTTLSFDIANLEIFLPLVVGARVVVASRGVAMDGRRLRELLESSGATLMQATPATWRILLEAGWKGNWEFKVLCGGEGLPRDLARDLQNRSGSVWNLYGPTETTVWSTVSEVRVTDQSITIGRPILNTQVYLLDRAGQPVPVGAPGELCIGGDGMARGYIQRPDLTAERFAANPFEVGTRLYRTGDLARYLSDGRLECLGRIDRQVKLRGYRIEIEEIETVLREHTAVRQAVVMVREDVPGDQRLVAYMILLSGRTEVTGEILIYLRERLPEYMIPSILIPLEALPLTSNGKIDYQALPTASESYKRSKAGFLGPRDEIERKLTRIWEELLGTRPVGVKDNFFDLGGHSLLATRLIARIEKTLGNVSLSDLFQSPTIESLARELRQKKKAKGDSALVLFRNGGSRPPLFVHGGSFELSRYLGEDQPCYGIRPHGQDGRRAPATVEEMAADYLKQIRGVQPQGPYLIGGFSFGGLVAYEMAQQLRQSGQEVGLLVLIDPTPPRYSASVPQHPGNGSIARPSSTLNRHLTALRQSDLKPLVAALRSRSQRLANAFKRGVCRAYLEFGQRIPSNLRMFYFFEVSGDAAQRYVPRSYQGRAVLLSSDPNTVGLWRSLVAGSLEVHELQGHHLDAIKGPRVGLWARQLRSSLNKALR